MEALKLFFREVHWMVKYEKVEESGVVEHGRRLYCSTY
jgi:hypothetical protein